MHKFHVQFNIASGRFDLRAIDQRPDGKTGAAKNVIFEMVEDSTVVEPFWSIEPEALQSLADQLWEVGIKPAGAMQAIATATQQAGGQVAPWLMRQLEKFIDQATKKEPHHG